MTFIYTQQPGLVPLERGQSTSGAALVSIITPYFNAGKHFVQTYTSVINQTFTWFEWIIVNDGSTDEESVRLLERIASQDKRIRVMHQEHQGPSAARNRAAAAGTTDILVMLDADDLIAPPFLESLYFALAYNPDAGWAYSDSVGFGAQEYLWSPSFSAARMKDENILVNTAAIRRNAFESVGGYDTDELYFHEDWHLWLKLLGAGHSPVHIGGYLFWYRRSHSGRLQVVQGDSTLRLQSKQKIRAAAARVDTGLTAKEYPVPQAPGQYNAPTASTWNRRTFQSHEKSHIMLLLPWLVMGGADQFNLDICRKIDKNKFEVSILTTVAAEQTWRQRFEEHVADIFDLPSFLDVKNYPEFISYFLRSREIDVLFLSNSYYGYYLLPWLRKEFPALVIIDYVHMEEWYWRNGGYARISGAMGEVLEKTYVCNEATRRVLLQQLHRSPDSVDTLYIGVDTDTFDPKKVTEGSVRAREGIADGRPIVLFPCRLHPQKRPFLMLEIAGEVRKRLPEIAFLVVGDGPQLEELKKCNRDCGLEDTVYFAGRQSDLRPYYRDSALTLICSIKEGLALTAYESLAMATPVVTADVGGQSELIDSTVGMVLPLLQIEAAELDSRDFTPREVQQYADAILAILSDDTNYIRMCSACRERVLSGYSSQLMIQKLEEFFQELCQNTEYKAKRLANSAALQRWSLLTGEFAALFGEIEAYEAVYKSAHSEDTKNELMRIATSKWGSRLIRLAFKLRLNKLF